MKMEDWENLMKLPTIVLFEEVTSRGTVELILGGPAKVSLPQLIGKAQLARGMLEVFQME
jgi:hypothetical protein